MHFQTSPRDLGVLLGAGTALPIVTVAAAVIPAWRAARVSPTVALRLD